MKAKSKAKCIHAPLARKRDIIYLGPLRIIINASNQLRSFFNDRII